MLTDRSPARFRSRRLRGGAALCAAAVLLGLAPAASAAARPAVLLTQDDPSSTILPELNVVEVTGPGVHEAETAVLAVLDDIDAAVHAQRAAEQQQVDLAAALPGLEQRNRQLNEDRDRAITARNAALGEADQARARLEAHQIEADAAKAVVGEIALESFVAGNDVEGVLSSPGLSPARQKTRYLHDAFEEQMARRGAQLEARAAAEEDEHAGRRRAAAHEEERLQLERLLAANAADIARNGTDRAAAQQGQQAAEAEQQRLHGVLVEAKTALAEARRTARVAGTDFPLVVLDAFVRAVDHQAANRPGCGLRWPVLAAISRVESGHGTSNGSSVDALGDTSSIYGPQLAPGSGFATITDTDGGALDGDPAFDRAVGPMQFIPSSWAIFALDGNDDGALDPSNYYDAALAAAEHLCRGGADTSTSAGLRAAVLGYNRSESYYGTVASVMNRYEVVAW